MTHASTSPDSVNPVGRPAPQGLPGDLGAQIRSTGGMAVTPWPVPLLDRLAAARDDEPALRELFAQGEVLPIGGDGRFPVTADGRGLVGVHDEAFDPQRHVLLGRRDARVWWARRATEDEAASWPHATTLRSLDLDDAAREVAQAGVGFLNWHATDPWCETCHQPTRMVAGGGSRRCPAGHEAFPRTDAAVIMAVTDEHDRLLLAHQASWPEGRCSILAGFVEAGESAEAAVAREVLEEVGLVVADVEYVHSQAWPFPRSLMLGFRATASGEPVPDGVEIAWARWYTRDEMATELDSGRLLVPGISSIAGRLIERWRAAGH